MPGSTHVMIEIGDDRIPGTPKERLFLALAEGATVLVLGKVPDAGRLVPSVGIYRTTDDGVGYQGWIYIEGHSNPHFNGLYYHEREPASFVINFPYYANKTYFVEGLAEPDRANEVAAVIALVLEPAPSKVN